MMLETHIVALSGGKDSTAGDRRAGPTVAGRRGAEVLIGTPQAAWKGPQRHEHWGPKEVRAYPRRGQGRLQLHQFHHPSSFPHLRQSLKHLPVNHVQPRLAIRGGIMKTIKSRRTTVLWPRSFGRASHDRSSPTSKRTIIGTATIV